ncbi:MAG TPA: holdfast anchoring protein HfaA [Rhizomicrobium sp.]|jgi:holdfast attachment protein HfaA
MTKTKTAANAKLFALAALFLATASAAQAGDYSNSSSYNQGYGMTAGEENQAVNPSLRDSNGNLTVVNGQFTSSNMSQQSGVQQMSTIGSMGSQGSFTNSTGVGGTSTATATAIGNQLNVVTVGNNNTVVVDSTQINNGNQTASSSTGH